MAQSAGRGCLVAMKQSITSRWRGWPGNFPCSAAAGGRAGECRPGGVGVRVGVRSCKGRGKERPTEEATSRSRKQWSAW